MFEGGRAERVEGRRELRRSHRPWEGWRLDRETEICSELRRLEEKGKSGDSRQRARYSSSSVCLTRLALLFCFQTHPKKIPKMKRSPATVPIPTMAASLSPGEEEEEEEEVVRLGAVEERREVVGI